MFNSQNCMPHAVAKVQEITIAKVKLGAVYFRVIEKDHRLIKA